MFLREKRSSSAARNKKKMPPQDATGDASPPSYGEATTSQRPVAVTTDSFRSAVRGEIQTSLRELSQKISYYKSTELQARRTHDEVVMTHIIADLQTFLTDFGQSLLSKGHLTFIPFGITDTGALPCDDDLRAPDEFVSLIKAKYIEGGQKESWDGPEAPSRLARYLQDIENKSPLDARREEAAEAEQASSSKRLFWGRESAAENPPSNEKASLPKVTIDVKAEQIVFRSQNRIGLYKTQSLWGLVVRVRVDAVGRRS